MLLLLVGCNYTVDEHNITSEITTHGWESHMDAAKALERELYVLCKRNGFNSVAVLNSSSYREYASRNFFGAKGVGECRGKNGVD